MESFINNVICGHFFLFWVILTVLGVLVSLSPLFIWFHVYSMRRTMEKVQRILDERAQVELKANQYICDSLLTISRQISNGMKIV